MTGGFLSLLVTLSFSNFPPAKVQLAIVAGTAPQNAETDIPQRLVDPPTGMIVGHDILNAR
ncbi:MAG: hypothetical protein ACR2KT_03940 [Methylocella sp.]